MATKPALSGSPPEAEFISSKANVFDWIFSNPFQEESFYTPAAQTVPKIEDERSVLVDDHTGKRAEGRVSCRRKTDVESQDRVLTRRQLRHDALALGSGLRKLGLHPRNVRSLPPTPTCANPQISPVVMIHMPNCLPFVTAMLGAWAAGLTVTLVSPAWTSPELAWALQNARPMVIITASTCAAVIKEALKAQEDKFYFSKVALYEVDIDSDTYPEAQGSATNPRLTSDWKQLMEDPGPVRDDDHRFSAATRTSVLLWSSGTSGRSKGVLLTHRAVIFAVLSYWNKCDFYQGQRQRWLGFAPYYHVLGLLGIFLTAMATGSTVYNMKTFKFPDFLEIVRRQKITHLHLPPPVTVMLAKSPLVEPYAKRDSQGQNAFSSVVGGMTGGAPTGYEIIEQVYKRLGFRMRRGYGLTEMGGATLQQGLSKMSMEEQRDDCGPPHWGIELMIAAKEESWNGRQPRPTSIAASGEVLIRSPGLLAAYLPYPSSSSRLEPDMSTTLEALTPDGWFRTGDVGFIDSEGRLHITDRLKELIKVRAFQVAPAELEALLCSSDSVLEAAVIGVYDAMQASEWPKAYLVVAGGTPKDPSELHKLANQLREIVEEQTARYKWLRGGIEFVDEIPKSLSGKILRRILRAGKVKGKVVDLYEPRKAAAKL